jgi:hypothetical protein
MAKSNPIALLPLIGQEKSTFPTPADYRAQYEALKKQFQTLERLNKLQDQRLADLERMIRKHAPELAREIGLEE